MLIDAAKGLEPQTRKLFEVCRLRGLPLFTFANKMDRPALTPYEIMDQIQEEFNLESFPVLWPIGDGDRFKGVLDRLENVVHLYQKSTTRGGKAEVVEVPFDESPEALKKLQEMIDDDELFGKLIEDREILDELISPLDMERVLAGQQVSACEHTKYLHFVVRKFIASRRTNSRCNHLFVSSIVLPVNRHHSFLVRQ